MKLKELQTTCDDLYYQFVCRLSHVTGFETIDKGDHNALRIKNKDRNFIKGLFVIGQKCPFLQEISLWTTY